jgi:hypothetical protein
MSILSRRALFGLSAGAVAAKVMPAPELRAENYFTEKIVGIDFGAKQTTIVWRAQIQGPLPDERIA